MPTGLFFDFKKASQENNSQKLEIVIQGIIKEMETQEKKFLSELEAVKNESVEKEGLFD
jgi:hypothetical protein